jgi:uncharacterized protein YbaP (TraB family)
MRFRLLVAAALLSAFTPALAFAQATPPPVAVPLATTDVDPALWVLKNKNTTIYLFGTIHVLKPGLGWFDEAVRKAFDSSDELVQEIVFPDAATTQAAVMKYSIATNGPPLTDQIPAEKRAAYAKAMTNLGFPANGFDRLKPWSAANNLTVMTLVKMGYDLNSGVEKTLTAAAEKEKKPILGLETLDIQLGYFDGLPKDAQIAFLGQTIDELPKAGAEIGTMIDRWSKGDPDGLAKELNESLEASPVLEKTLLTDRNRRWADWIKARMTRPGTVFIAVGAGHLAGKNSVQAFLGKLHLKVKRIAY